MRHTSIICLVPLLVAAWAEDWPQWRGPHRDGIAVGFAEPKTWPEKLTLKWKVAVGEGHSSPVVADGVIYLHTRQGDREVITALHPENGQTIWQEGYNAPYSMNPAATTHGKGVKSTPAVEDGRIFTFGISGILSCFDAKTGKLQWRKEFGSPDFGVATSPMVDHGRVIVYVGGNTPGALTAFDAATGAEKWSWKGDGPAYASPILVEIAGTRQVVTQSRSNIVSVSADTGNLLWQIPFTTPYAQNIVTPVLHRDTLIFSGIDNPVMGVKVFKHDAQWTTETVWKNKDFSMYMSSPVVSGDLLFGFSERKRGQFFCLKPDDGSTLWASEGRQADSAAIVAAGSAWLILTPDANLIVARQSDKAFEPLRKYSVADSPTWAHPVVLGRGILIKDATHLALWEP
ncbi:MAG TPA: PQQ-binding-like beta-propeller repeat protein [Bryobacteraceae bacterium]|jgi:outer membrane protein assembly factor BamB|nr:PQQ-binding-like beta-propeller repeat protein [Bryobacteraceae bacterium]